MEALETIKHVGVIRRVMRVEYKSVAGSGIPEQAKTQGIAWVDPKTGDVLRRDIFLGNSKLRFVRLPKQAATAAGLKLFEDQLLTAEPLAGDAQPSDTLLDSSLLDTTRLGGLAADDSIPTGPAQGDFVPVEQEDTSGQ